MERKPSKIIQDFLDLMERAPKEYDRAKKEVEKYNSKTFTWTHDLEDAADKAERNKLATAWQKELKQRRIEKDHMKMWGDIRDIANDVAFKSCLKRLRWLVERQKKNEAYVNTPYKEREYKKAVRDNENSGG